MGPSEQHDDSPERPCPFCGRMSPSGQQRCPRCRLGLHDKTVRSLQRVMGPWFVLDEENLSAPGVSWEKFLTLIERGKVGPTSIVRGPGTAGLWKFARDAPAVATQLGMCWSCHAALSDESATRCDRCGVRTNAPVRWGTEHAGTPPQEPDQPDDDQAILDLVRAGGSPSDGRRAARRRIPGRWAPLLTLAAMAVVALALATIGLSVYQYLVGSSDRGGARTDVPSPRPEPPRQTTAPLSAPGDKPDMFPSVPPYRELTSRQASKPTPPPPPQARAGRPVATAPSSYPADDPDLARRRGLAAEAYGQALKARDDGDLMKAQVILVAMLNANDDDAWPDGAVETLRDIQQQIRAASRPADDALPPEQLTRQRQSASRMYREALARRDRHDLTGAQDLLVRLLNDHHPQAWPEGAVETLRQVQDALRQPATAPRFYDTGPPRR